MNISAMLQELAYCWQERRLPARLARFVHGRYPLNTNVIHLDITMSCSLNCVTCNRSCSNVQAQSSERMSIEQIYKFLRETRDLGKRWNRIIVAGGEPTLHPDFAQIVEALHAYCLEQTPHTKLIVMTNGFTGHTRQVLSQLPLDIEIANTSKTEDNPEHHFAFNQSPWDNGCNCDRYEKGCGAMCSCGIGLTRNGYYVCGAAGAIDRVFGIKLAIKSLADALKPRATAKQQWYLCRHCGILTETPYDKATNNISKSWRETYRLYREKQPVLEVY